MLYGITECVECRKTGLHMHTQPRCDSLARLFAGAAAQSARYTRSSLRGFLDTAAASARAVNLAGVIPFGKEVRILCARSGWVSRGELEGEYDEMKQCLDL